MSNTTYIETGTGISGTRLAVMTMAPAWPADLRQAHVVKPRVAPFGQSTADNSRQESARKHRHT